MKLVTLAVAGFLFAVVPGSASAEPVDCEAARCTVQASIDLECPCAEAKNHGRYTACVKRVVNRLVREGAVSKKCRTKINGCAIRSTCGKRDGSVACQLPGSSVTSRCRPLASAAACTSRGGTVVESCCESCAGPVPTVTPTEVPEPTATETATPEPVATETATPEPVATQTTVPEPTETPLPEPTTTEPPPVATPTVTATQAAEPTPTEAAPTVTAAEPTGTPVEPTGTPAEPTSTPVAPTSTAVAPTATTTEVAATATTTPVAPTPTETAVPTLTAVPTTTATVTPVPTLTSTPVPTVTATTTPVPTATSTPQGDVCGDGVVTGDEQCDVNAPQPRCPDSGNGLEELCTLDCTCACPTKITFSGDAFAPESILDTGWTGIAHRAPIISNGDVTVAVDACEGAARPCGVCTISGPVENALEGQHQNQRCTNDTSIQCENDSPCTLGGGTCEFFFGSTLPLAAGGVTTCVVNQFNGPVTGSANIETGEAVTNVFLTSRVYNGVAIDNPCPRCIGDTGINDGATGGTCDAGPRAGLACDGNGTVADRPDFGTTSLDCPPDPDGLIATLPIDLSSATDPVTKTLTSGSPNCRGSVGEKCLCETCNNVNQEPCSANDDCPDPDGAGGFNAICGGRRCLGGANNGAPCPAGAAGASVCPGGACNQPGTPPAPSACLDDTGTVNTLDCTDTAPVDGEGECTNGPVDNNCSVASGHAQRGCLSDADCGGTPGSCATANRNCFLTGGGSFQPVVANLKVGTDTLVAAGEEDTPVNDTSNPTLGAVFCVAPTGSASVNNVAGLPGPGRVTIKGTARGLP